MNALNIHIVEDEDNLRETMADAIAEEGHHPTSTHDISYPIENMIPPGTDLVLLDLMLPSGSGFELIRYLKQATKIPVIVVSAMDTINNRIRGLDLGADDYLIKPFSLRELLARIRSVARRTGMGVIPTQEITCGPIRLNLGDRRVSLDGENVPITQREFDILDILVMNRERVVSREEILDRVSDQDSDVTSNSLDVHIYNLRKKFDQETIQTSRGIGFQIRTDWS